jgi:hypothetical protein
MRIRYLSDLHLEFRGELPDALPSIGEDLVVLAGDIDIGAYGVLWANRMFPDRPVVYVLGNHEFYDHRWELLVDTCRAVAAPNVHVLENDVVQIGELTVLGCTLWTDFALYGPDRQAQSMEAAMQMMADFRVIRLADRNLFAADVLARFQHSRTWLEKTLEQQTTRALVVTHHAPTALNRNPAFAADDILNPCFHSELIDSLRPARIAAWICGHHHYNSVVRVGDGDASFELCSNQRGYATGEVKGFSWDRTIEIPTAGNKSGHA